MTKYVNYYQKPVKPLKERLEPHPVWRGIGLILAIVLPAMSYFLVNYAVQNPSKYPWLTIPKELIVNKLWDPLILIKVLFTLGVTLAFFMVIALITFVIYSLSGVNRK